MLKHKTNPQLVALIQRCKRTATANEAPIWRAIGQRLEKPLRVWREVNVGELGRILPDSMVGIVAGKVLGGGVVERPITVAAFSFTESAKRKIEASGGEALTIDEALQKWPDGTKLQVVA